MKTKSYCIDYRIPYGWSTNALLEPYYALVRYSDNGILCASVSLDRVICYAFNIGLSIKDVDFY